MFSIFKQERDSQGREFVEMGMNAALFKIVAIAGPLAFLGFAYFAMGWGPMGMPWYLIAAPVVFAAIGYPMSAWMSRRSIFRITIDSKAGKLLVGTSGGQSEVRIADVEKAEFGLESGDEGTTLYRFSDP